MKGCVAQPRLAEGLWDGMQGVFEGLHCTPMIFMFSRIYHSWYHTEINKICCINGVYLRTLGSLITTIEVIGSLPQRPRGVSIVHINGYKILKGLKKTKCVMKDFSLRLQLSLDQPRSFGHGKRPLGVRGPILCIHIGPYKPLSSNKQKRRKKLYKNGV